MEEKMEEKEKENIKEDIKDKEKKIEDKEKKIASNIKAEAEEIDKSLSEVIREQATEDEAPQSRTFSLRKILGGDILSTSFMRRQIWLFLLIALFIVVYIANRYSCQQDIIEIDALQKELKDAKYKALSSNSKLTEESRQSNVLDMLKENKDSTLKLPTQPPYIITVPDK
jgi:preprotein translocase subunit SecF